MAGLLRLPVIPIRSPKVLSGDFYAGRMHLLRLELRTNQHFRFQRDGSGEKVIAALEASKK